MTVAEAVERLELERDWAERQLKSWRCGGEVVVVGESSISRGGGQGRRRRRSRATEEEVDSTITWTQ